ncbi:MAG: hypothetical protein ACYCWW_19005 [Deltaproteobacteria bacterium]
MTSMKLLALALLAAAPTVYSYKDKAGVEHFVQSEDEVPKGVEPRRIDLGGTSLNTDLARRWRQADEAQSKRAIALAKEEAPPSKVTKPAGTNDLSLLMAIGGGILLFLLPGILLGWLRSSNRRLLLWLAIADLACGAALCFAGARGLGQATQGLDLNPLHALPNAERAKHDVEAAEQRQEETVEKLFHEAPAAKPAAR